MCKLSMVQILREGINSIISNVWVYMCQERRGNSDRFYPPLVETNIRNVGKVDTTGGGTGSDVER